MLIKKYNSIMEREESHRNKWALGLTFSLSLFIFTSFMFYRGFLGFGSQNIVQKNPTNQVATVVATDLAPSPLESSKQTFGKTLGEIVKQYEAFKQSMSDVFVPFITGIEVYERK